jgi:hypothetical protein
VKQRCVSEQFTVINDKMEMVARFFYIKQKMRGREQDNGETERERVCERQNVADRVNKIDC